MQLFKKRFINLILLVNYGIFIFIQNSVGELSKQNIVISENKHKTTKKSVQNSKTTTITALGAFSKLKKIINPKTCGIQAIQPLLNPQNLNNRIINGQPAVPNSWPWVVSIYANITTKYNYVCGGSLVSSLHIITAAHCVVNFQPSSLVVVIGAHFLNESLRLNNTFKVSKSVVHQNYSRVELIDDIAILELKKEVVFSDKIAPICLPSSKDTETIYNKEIIVVGW